MDLLDPGKYRGEWDNPVDVDVFIKTALAGPSLIASEIICKLSVMFHLNPDILIEYMAENLKAATVFYPIQVGH